MKTLIVLLALAALIAAPSAMAAQDAGSKPTLTIRSSAYGRVIFDSNGRALYAFTADRRGSRRSNCSGACLRAWPAYVPTGALRAAAGSNRRLLGTIRRADGRRQTTYNGWPLYYYVGDRRPGQILCQNVREFGGLWLVVRPNGTLVR
jgi:predicted lipoprotein with Yx(FWY)xxD motif